MHKRRLLLAWLVGALIVAVIGVIVVLGGSGRYSATVAVPSAGSGPLVAFYGDSYTLGTGASDDARRWSTQISHDRGWQEFNPSVNGLGFIDNRDRFGAGDLPDLIITAKPDIVFVVMGLNDNFSYDFAAQDIKAQISDDLSRLSAALPDARFVVVEPFWYTDERPRSVEVIISWVRSAATAIGADYIAGASRWIEGHPEWMAADGLHPNDDGYLEMARRMDLELEALGL